MPVPGVRTFSYGEVVLGKRSPPWTVARRGPVLTQSMALPDTTIPEANTHMTGTSVPRDLSPRALMRFCDPRN
eukprot:460408-Rhodomonas_salina.2